MIIGYIDKLADISVQILIKQLLEAKGLIRRKVWKISVLGCSSISAAAARGMLVKILGHEVQ